MNLVLTYVVTVFIIVVSAFLSLYFSPERKRKYEEKKAIVAFHIYNVLFIIMTSSVVHVVMTIYVIGNKSKLTLQLAILLFIVLQFYILGNIVLEHYKFVLRKYVKDENGKVLFLNKSYLKWK